MASLRYKTTPVVVVVVSSICNNFTNRLAIKYWVGIFVKQSHISQVSTTSHSQMLTRPGNDWTLVRWKLEKMKTPKLWHYQEEMRLSPRLNQHASGVVLGVTQIINGLYNPVSLIIITITIFFIIIIIIVVVVKAPRQYKKLPQIWSQTGCYSST